MFQQSLYFLVAGLVKVLIPPPHGAKRLWCGGADDLIGHALQLPAAFGGTDRHRGHQTRRLLLVGTSRAARMVEPVASPSSTTITVRPRN